MGKKAGHFAGSCSSETLRPIFKKIGVIDYLGDETPQANFEINQCKGAWLRMREVQIKSNQIYLAEGPRWSLTLHSMYDTCTQYNKIKYKSEIKKNTTNIKSYAKLQILTDKKKDHVFGALT